MDNFKEALIQFAHSNPSLFPNDADTSYPMLIEQCFPQFFADFQTPDHPPYAAMIYRAIWELNKKGGSSEKSISKFIKKEYADLPWAHSTLLKHHLEKLCDRNEIRMTHNQCYLLAGAESESEKKSSGASKKRKKQKSLLGSESGTKISSPHKKYKKKKKCLLNIKETSVNEQMRLNKRKRKRNLKSKRKSSKRVKKHAINEEIKLQLNEANLKEKNDGSLEQKQMLEVNMNEVEQESDRDNSGYINLEQIQTKKNPELLQSEESPDSNLGSHGNGKRVWTRSQLKTISQKDASDKPAVVENPSNEKQQISRSPSSEKPLIELLKSRSSKLTTRLPDDVPTTGQRSAEVQDPINSQQDQQLEKSTVEDKPKYKRHGKQPKPMEPEKDEVLRPISSKLTTRLPDDEPTTGQSSTEVQDLLNSQLDQQPGKSSVQDKPKYKRCGRNPKPMEPEKDKVLRHPKRLRKSQKSAKKGKVVNKKVQPKNKRDVGYKMTRRSSRKPSC